MCYCVSSSLSKWVRFFFASNYSLDFRLFASCFLIINYCSIYITSFIICMSDSHPVFHNLCMIVWNSTLVQQATILGSTKYLHRLWYFAQSRLFEYEFSFYTKLLWVSLYYFTLTNIKREYYTSIYNKLHKNWVSLSCWKHETVS